MQFQVHNIKRMMALLIIISLLLCIASISIQGDAFAATKITATSSNGTVCIGGTATVTANQKVSWSIASGAKYVKIVSKASKTVVVKGIKKGTAYVQAKSGKKYKKVKIIVKKINAPKSITLVTSSSAIDVASYCTVDVRSVTPSDAVTDVYFSSSDSNIAEVYSDGSVRGMTPGTVTITATSKYNNSVKSSVTITVNDAECGCD